MVQAQLTVVHALKSFNKKGTTEDKVPTKLRPFVAAYADAVLERNATIAGFARTHGAQNIECVRLKYTGGGSSGGPVPRGTVDAIKAACKKVCKDNKAEYALTGYPSDWHTKRIVNTAQVAPAATGALLHSELEWLDTTHDFVRLCALPTPGSPAFIDPCTQELVAWIASADVSIRDSAFHALTAVPNISACGRVPASKRDGSQGTGVAGVAGVAGTAAVAAGAGAEAGAGAGAGGRGVDGDEDASPSVVAAC